VILRQPADYTVRPARLQDLEPVLHLMIAQNVADYGEPMISTDTLRDLWQSPGLALESDTWVVLAPDTHIVGYADARCNLARTRFQPSVYVATEHRNRGIGTYLLQLAEARAVARAAELANLRLVCRVSERNPAGKHILETAGYSSNLSFQVMEIVMAAPPAGPQWPNGIGVRTFVSGQDEQTTYRVDEGASQDKGYHQPLTFDEWAARMSLHQETFDPTLWFLASSKDEIVGVALNLYSPETDTGWVDHLGVLRHWRKRGVGTALLRHSLGEFYRRGIRRVRLSVDAKSLTDAPRLYERAGMQTVQRYHIYTKESGWNQ